MHFYPHNLRVCSCLCSRLLRPASLVHRRRHPPVGQLPRGRPTPRLRSECSVSGSQRAVMRLATSQAPPRPPAPCRPTPIKRLLGKAPPKSRTKPCRLNTYRPVNFVLRPSYLSSQVPSPMSGVVLRSPSQVIPTIPLFFLGCRSGSSHNPHFRELTFPSSEKFR